tara:strand:+ start:2137 stop:2562 length:426 start_codon:yes stop_codon:yes gene_type:complete
MINYIAIDDDGMVIMSGTAMDEAEAILDVGTEGTVLTGPQYENGRVNCCYVKSGILRECPPSPSPMHEFDCASEVWVDMTTDDERAAIVRAKRNELLSASDWTQAADAPVDPAAWAAYRQKLRDLPADTADLGNIVWPTPP